MRAPVPLDDAVRVAALHRLGVLDLPPAADLEGLTRLAAFVTGAMASVVNLLDTDRQWQAASTGMPCAVSPRSESMCAHTVAEDRLVHVSDARLDVRFADSAYVDGRAALVRMYAGVPLHDVDGHAIGTLCVVDAEVRTLTEPQLSALRDLAAQAEQLFELRRQHQALTEVLADVDHDARHDPLTGLVNRRVLLDRLEHALVRAQRTGAGPTLFLCDLDGFKQVNDRHGHQEGDQALVETAQQLRALVRPADTVARLGGDEFVVLCEDLAECDVAVVADRLRQTRYGTRGLRLSVGMTRAGRASTCAQALAEADRRMYVDKGSRCPPAVPSPRTGR